MPQNRKISVVGLGYVGLPVAVAFGKKGRVIGYDINEKRIAELHEGIDITREVEPEDLKNTDIHFTTDLNDLRQADFHIVAAPTPLNEAKQPDLSPLLSATKSIGNILKSGDIVVYESTVYPGCIEENCVQILENQSGLNYINNSQRYSKDSGAKKGFFLGYSPERINPGDKEHTFVKIKKVVCGSTPEITEILAETYSSVVKAGVHCTSSIKVAEAAKVIENAQRDLNIAFVNELALIFNRLDIDTNEVLEAAGTKWNFLPFRPGLVGGHCIGVDPYYLTHSAERTGYRPQVILAGRQINDGMSNFIVQETVKTMAAAKIGAVDAKVTVLGLTFKEDCPDLRNSRIPDIVSDLNSFGCNVQIHDPLCDPEDAWNEFGLKLCLENELQPASALILAVSHRIYREWKLDQWQNLLKPGGIVVDVKNIVPGRELLQKGHLIWSL